MRRGVGQRALPEDFLCILRGGSLQVRTRNIIINLYYLDFHSSRTVQAVVSRVLGCKCTVVLQVMTARRTVIQFYKINEYFRQFESDGNEAPTNNNYSEAENGIHDESQDGRAKRRKADLHKQCRRGGKAFEAGHVKNFTYDPSLCVIKGNVRASMRNHVYKPTVSSSCCMMSIIY